jgi:hypothetical protein
MSPALAGGGVVQNPVGIAPEQEIFDRLFLSDLEFGGDAPLGSVGVFTADDHHHIARPDTPMASSCCQSAAASLIDQSCTSKGESGFLACPISKSLIALS